MADRIQLDAGELRLFHPDGQQFTTFVELHQRAAQAEHAQAAERTHVEELLNRLRALGQEP
jgi:hypothetical protein